MNKPEYLCEAGAKKWDQIQNEQKDRFKFLNRDLVGAYCSAFARWREMEDWIRGGTGGEDRKICTIRDDKGNIKSYGPSPQLKIAKEAVMEMKTLAKQLDL